MSPPEWERLLDFDLEPKYLALQEEASALAHSIESFASEADELSTVHPGIVDALRSSGLCRLMVPAQYGGRFERIDPLAVCVVREKLMASSSHLDSLFALQGIGSFPLVAAGSPSMKEEWLPRVAELDSLAALALTEPRAGSDLKAVETTLTSVEGHEAGIRVDGEKSFISNGGAAGFYSVFAREEDGHSMVLVPAYTDGLEFSQTPELMAPHVLGELHLNGVVVPYAARIGPPGRGLSVVLETLATFRVSVAGAAVGLAQAALEEAVRHAKRREQFGKPLARLGPVAQLLADSHTEIEMARLLTYRAAARAKHDPRAALKDSSMAKLAATEIASRVVDRSVQIMGRWGLIRYSKIERLYRQARPMRIYEGSSEVLRLGIASDLCDQVR